MSDRTDIERVREQVDLVALISEYVPLQPKGREWVGICPFHDDHKPSMRVVTHKENAFYKCFSCGAYGDCIKFVREYLKKDFGEALQFLAERVGIELSNQPRNEEKNSIRKKIRNAIEWASQLYQDQLSNSDEGALAFKLLHLRGFENESIEKFMIGVAPNSWTYLTDLVKDNDDRIFTCLEAGLLKKKDSTDRIYDSFRHRIMFPICDESGSPVAFGGRIINEEDEPKYINSPETELFHKSKVLYGYHLARAEMQKTKTAIVVEGYTDVIACHQIGVTNVIATLGTSLTEQHASKLSRICEKVILVFDGDDAGQRAADRAVEVFFSKDIDVQICVLPEGSDPADLASSETDLMSFFDKSVDAISFKLDRLECSLSNTDTISGKARRIELFLDELVRLGIGKLSGIRKPLIYERLASLIKVSIEEVESFISKRTEPTKSNKPSASNDDKKVTNISRARQIAEHELIGVLIFDPTESSAAIRENGTSITSDDFKDETANKIAINIIPRLQNGISFSMPELLEELDEPARVLASTLYFTGERICTTYESVMLAANMTIRSFVNLIEDKAIADEVQTLSNVSDPGDRLKLAQEMLETIRKHKTSRSAS
ncbi:MAG: DNA primase [Phycisphaerales bacterium]|jgi:DNA primase|nr:DNA primase [Phycisphaerales bacterium]